MQPICVVPRHATCNEDSLSPTLLVALERPGLLISFPLCVLLSEGLKRSGEGRCGAIGTVLL